MHACSPNFEPADTSISPSRSTAAGTPGATRRWPHEGGRVSTFLYDFAHPGLVVGIGAVGGTFELDRNARRLLFVSGGSGITPIMSMVRTLRATNYDGEIAVVYYSRTPGQTCYADELAAMPGVRVLHGYTRHGQGDLVGHVSAEHLRAGRSFTSLGKTFFFKTSNTSGSRKKLVCGPPALAEAVLAVHPDAQTESFVPVAPATPAESSGGLVLFADSAITVTDDGRSLLEQAEAAGLNPESGCRMGICHSCTRRKTSGAVKNLRTGKVSTAEDENIQICVTAPLSDVELAL